MAMMSHLLTRLKREPLDDLPIAEHFDQLLRDSGQRWRERLLPPLVTLRLFLIQILGGNCAITELRQLGGIDFAPSSYCEARAEKGRAEKGTSLIKRAEKGERKKGERKKGHH